MTTKSSKAPRSTRKSTKVDPATTQALVELAQAHNAVAPADLQITVDVEGNRFEADGTPAFDATAPRTKAAFRGAGFVKFRAEHDPRWCEKAQKHVHDNEDDLADQLAYEIATYGWWSAPLVIEHLGHKLHELRAKYASLNAGMVRMNLGNQIRASIRRARKAAEAATK